ncbi:MAG: selenide, water dikinase SelD [Myxococcales bacterium]|nr:selenide, water dikinase SelD [Myxococcales bacterium]
MVGPETLDDAAVFEWSGEACPTSDVLVVTTLDVITPIVDDAYDFGCIAAANALSDVYAMGGEPRFALNFLAVPNTLPRAVVREILAGGQDTVRAAGAAIVGGHSLSDDEPKYGLSVTGAVSRIHLRTNATARPGDVLILTKALGTGLLAAALKRGELEPLALASLTASMKRLNASAARVGRDFDVGALTDITGFGLLGHLMQVALASGVSLTIDPKHLPALPLAAELAAKAALASAPTGAAGRNLSYVLPCLDGLPTEGADLRLAVDPQTSGGLLFTTRADGAPAFIRRLHEAGDESATIIGMVSGPAERGASRIGWAAL